MAFWMVAVLILAMTGHSSGAWCVCKDLGEAALQKTLDYACGAGADCNPTHQNGPCFAPNTVRAHCNYAVNSFFQKKGQSPAACDFAGTATVTASNPSTTGCSYPTGVSTAGTGSTTVSPTPVTTTPSSTGTTTPISGTGIGTTTPISGTGTGTGTGTTSTGTTSATPYSGTSTGVLGGAGTTLGPSGTDTDYSDAGFTLRQSITLFTLVSTLSVLFWVSP